MDPFSDMSLFGVFEEGEEKKDEEKKVDKRKRDSAAVAMPNFGVNDMATVKKVKEEKTDLGEGGEDMEVDQEGGQEVNGEGNEKQGEEEVEDLVAMMKAVTHSVVTPEGVEVTEEMRHPAWPPVKQAREYPFELDPFQKMSCACLERRESVLVSAHTSAGKTAVAEYAIAMGLRDKQRVIYTSPIKALSNQKYRELEADFTDVGLMTGDVTINPTASCIVMTTEILRSMLYRGSEVMREVGTVIFDEIHYMKDPSRGVVWEETIILLPQKVCYAFLSATIPNAEEFAGWIADIHKQVCHVVYTDVRPVPLQHYIFPSGGDGLHLVVDESSKFREDNFQRAISGVTAKQTGGRVGASKQSGHSDIFKIVKMIMNKNYDPVIVFAFSKRECEGLALQMGKLVFNNPDEKALVREIFNNAISTLSDDDKELPQIQHVLPLLQKGIGIHHSGLLPLIKEVIEILFQEGLIKCLFATETFAMGLNMPAHTAVFSSVRKFDGKEFRWINGGEYIQMSGRAGRRGTDDRGIVILMVDEKMEPEVAKNMLKGRTKPLISAFHITYSMLLNLLRVEGIDPTMLISSSFAAFQKKVQAPQLEGLRKSVETQILDLELKLSSVGDDIKDAVQEMVKIKSRLKILTKEWEAIVMHPIHCLPYLQTGRLAQVAVGNQDSSQDWSVIMAFHRRGQGTARADYVLDVILKMPSGQWEVAAVPLDHVTKISSLRIPLPKDLRTDAAKESVGKRVGTVLKRFAPHGPPLLDPLEDMHLEKNEALTSLIPRIALLEQKLAQPHLQRKEVLEIFPAAMELFQCQKEKAAIDREKENSQEGYLAADLEHMRRVLRRLQFTTEDNVIDVKGRVACEIQTNDELLLVEMVFNGIFNDLSPELIATLLSCFVYDGGGSKKGKGEDEKDTATGLSMAVVKAIPTDLLNQILPSLRVLHQLARRVASVMQESRIEISPDEYVGKFKVDLMNVVYRWATGAKFVDICKLTSIFEGHIIRCMRRLEELLRQLMQASKSIGNVALEHKFSEAILCIRRDIVFSQSLYL